MAERANNNDDEFAGIPDMPSDDAIRAELLRTGGPAHWRPYGSGNGETNFDGLPETTVQRVLQARLEAGPGPNANEWQYAIWDQHRRMAELETEKEKLLGQLDEARSFDPSTGEAIPMIDIPERRKAIVARIGDIVDEQARIEGEPGRIKLDKKLAEAVIAEKRKIKQAYIVSEAKRRAASSVMDEEIERLASGFRKTAARS